METFVKAPLGLVWNAWNNPTDIQQWNAAADDWHTTKSSVDLREGGTFRSRMEAKDGSEGFDFEGTYTRVAPNKTIAYRMSDGREVTVEFAQRPGGVQVTENVRSRDGKHARTAAPGLAGDPRQLQASRREQRGVVSFTGPRRVESEDP